MISPNIQFQRRSLLKLLAASSEESPIPARNEVNALTPPQAAGNARPEFINRILGTFNISPRGIK